MYLLSNMAILDIYVRSQGGMSLVELLMNIIEFLETDVIFWGLYWSESGFWQSAFEECHKHPDSPTWHWRILRPGRTPNWFPITKEMSHVIHVFPT